jgi:hypothetical protein
LRYTYSSPPPSEPKEEYAYNETSVKDEENRTPENEGDVCTKYRLTFTGLQAVTSQKRDFSTVYITSL